MSVETASETQFILCPQALMQETPLCKIILDKYSYIWYIAFRMAQGNVLSRRLD